MTPEEVTAIVNEELADQPEKLKRILMSNAPGKRKYPLIRIEAERLERAVAPYAACKGKGCAHCCYVAVSITEREAMIIGEHVGRAPAKLSAEHVIPTREKTTLDQHLYTGTPCPFLAADKSCSIYEVRPTTCITYHSLNADPEDCNVAKTTTIVRVNPHNISLITSAIDMPYTVGDIREYFP